MNNSSLYTNTELSLRFGSWNIDTNLARTEDGYASDCYEQWRIGHRTNSILTYIEAQQLDIVQIQEARRCVLNNGRIVDSITPIVDGLHAMGFETVLQPYNPTGGKCFYYIVGYRNVKLVGSYPRWVTKTPAVALDRVGMTDEEIKDHNFGAFFERCFFVTEFENGAGVRFNCINVHMDIPWMPRYHASRILAEYLNDIAGDALRFICSGDFNSFPDWNGSEQLALIEFDDALSEYKSTFIAYPYDFGKDHGRLVKNGLFDKMDALDVEEKREFILDTFKNECSALGGNLDHMFHNGWSSVEGKLVLTCEDNIEFEEEPIKAYILEMAALNKPAFASDHQLCVAVLKF